MKNAEEIIDKYMYKKSSVDIVSNETRECWKKMGYPDDMVAFFYQKNDYENEWEWITAIMQCESSSDFETVWPSWDFDEGHTHVKDLTLVPLDEVLVFYAEQKGLKA